MRKPRHLELMPGVDYSQEEEAVYIDVAAVRAYLGGFCVEKDDAILLLSLCRIVRKSNPGLKIRHYTIRGEF